MSVTQLWPTSEPATVYWVFIWMRMMVKTSFPSGLLRAQYIHLASLHHISFLSLFTCHTTNIQTWQIWTKSLFFGLILTHNALCVYPEHEWVEKNALHKTLSNNFLWGCFWSPYNNTVINYFTALVRATALNQFCAKCWKIGEIPY